MNKYTVKDLIRDLKKMPQDAEVIYQAHDNYENEVGDWIKDVYVLDFDKMPKSEIGTKGIKVCISS